jgi:hypothetical protein
LNVKKKKEEKKTKENKMCAAGIRTFNLWTKNPSRYRLR